MRNGREIAFKLLGLALIGAVGCSTADAGQPRNDADADASAGLGSPDASPDPWAAGDAGGSSASDASSTPPLSSSEADRDGAGCLDFVDNDGNGDLDCDDSVCRSAGVSVSCCVGQTDLTCCTASGEERVTSPAGSPASLEFEGVPLTGVRGTIYAGESLRETCGVSSAAAFAPIGTSDSHGYLALPKQLDPRASHVTIEGRIGVRTPDADGYAAAGFGLFAEASLGTIARPLVAVVVTSAGNELRVIEEDRVVGTIAAPTTSCAASLLYRLTLSPDGGYTVERTSPELPDPEWTLVFSAHYDVPASARVALFGQQPNPIDSPAAWVADVSIGVNGCDRLDPARHSDAIVLDRAHDVASFTVFPHAATGDDHEALVLSGGRIHWMSVRTSDGRLASSTPADPFADVIQPAWAELERVTHVSVALDEHGVHRVFLAAATHDEPDELAIFETTYTPAAAHTTPGTLGGAPWRVADASTLDLPGATGVDAPSALHVSAVRQLVLVGRVRFDDGHTELRILPLGGEGSDEPVAEGAFGRDASGVTTAGLLRANHATSREAFDRDEVSEPRLFELDHVARVLYAGRRGTRWSIGQVVASSTFTHFIQVSDAPVLGGSGSGSGFDALGVSAPTIVRAGGVDRLYFLGTDGATRGIGLATQPAFVRE